MTLKIISAEQIEFEGTIEQVTLPGVMGQFQVLKNHAALIAALQAGKMSYVADVKDNVVSVCLY